jgi:hypothetical protein
MEPDELLGEVASACETVGIPYFITGSMATIAYGEPRFTNDIDTVVDLPASKAHAFCAMFDCDEYYVSQRYLLSEQPKIFVNVCWAIGRRLSVSDGRQQTVANRT